MHFHGKNYIFPVFLRFFLFDPVSGVYFKYKKKYETYAKITKLRYSSRGAMS